MSTPILPPPVHFVAHHVDTDDLVTADIRLAIAQEPVHLRLTVPSGPTTSRALLPIWHGLTSHIVAQAEAASTAQGRPISCQKGCGACCQQLVPIARAEAYALQALVDAMPPARQSVIRARFAAAAQRLHETGVLERLLRRAQETEPRSLGLAYFAAGVPCPFLEEGACSIHPDRPLACREYLVTSPAEACADPQPETIRTVPLPVDVSRAIRLVDRVDASEAPQVAWVPLILALAWAEAHPEPEPTATGPALVQAVFAALTGASPDRP